MGLVALWHVGSSQTRVRTHVPCIGRRIPNHCATKEVQFVGFKWGMHCSNISMFSSVLDDSLPKSKKQQEGSTWEDQGESEVGRAEFN